MARPAREVSSWLLAAVATFLAICPCVAQAGLMSMFHAVVGGGQSSSPSSAQAPADAEARRAAAIRGLKADCPSDTKTCPNAIVLHRQPDVDCDFPACPDEEWKVFCDPDCNGKNMCEEHCSGSETQSIACPSQPPCPGGPSAHNGCVPRDCKLNEWSQWAVEGCTGLCNRSRTFVPNACGGAPCVGRLHETMWCASPCNPSVDCEFSAWTPWGICDRSGLRHRSRVVSLPASGDGTPCDGTLQDTQSCVPTSKKAVNCSFSDWASWSGCSATCGGGYHSRTRSINTAASYGGSPCNGEMMEMSPCGTNKCTVDLSNAVDCQLSTWAPWSGCQANGGQSYRSRSVDMPSSGGGKACHGAMEEIEACHKELLKPVNCELTLWSEWTACSKTCDGGQTYRQRQVKADPQHGGALCQDALSETKVCNKGSCAGGSESGNCQLSAWGQWSGCTETCGEGMENRQRHVTHKASQGGEPCAEPVIEIRGCPKSPPCKAQDCLWADWTVWSHCTRTCGSGTSRRTRSIKKQPQGDGKPCDPMDSTLELKMCKTEDCPKECVDGVWDEWSHWSQCTRTCGGGAQWRHRKVAVQGNDCGKPASGPSSQFLECNTKPCKGDRNCELSEWAEWSECSKSCGGSQTRDRKIKVQATVAGRSCQDALSQLRSCNSASAKECGSEVTDCKMHPWTAWSQCSATCEGGQMERSRTVAVHARNGGKSCSSDLRESAGCHATQRCHPNAKDCKWSPWGEWNACSACDGERTRVRKILQYPEHGVACDPSGFIQVGRCQRHCEGKTLYYCVWNDWTEGPCASKCGKSSRTKVRHLHRVKEPPKDSSLEVGKLHADYEACNATQVLHEACTGQPECMSTCVPKDCSFSDWSEWQQPHGDDCNGLCTATRQVATHSNECGLPCKGITKRTKQCINPKCVPQDCEWGAWSSWDKSKCSGADGQKFRDRKVKTNPLNGGQACSGTEKQVAPCKGLEPIACQFSQWQVWSSCDRTCGLGKRFRQRQVQAPAQNGGQPCMGPMKIVEGCSAKECVSKKVDCEMSDWTLWYGCRNHAGDQAYRTRMIKTMAAGGGAACSGRLKETGSCGTPQPTDCVMGEWGAFGRCTSTCGGGQHFRTRQVMQEALNGGKPCVQSIHDTAACNTDPCPSGKNCEVGSWSEWSSCDPSCGQGISKRERKITKPPEEGGVGCNLVLKEVKTCKGESCAGVQDCKIGSWTEWSGCKKAIGCGVGYREKERKVIQAAGVGGHACEAGKLREVESHGHCPGTCHETCINGKWEDWSEWSACDVTCGSNGKRSRHRKALKANHCGFPAEGPNTEFAGCDSGTSCPGHKDCVWSDWSSWEACSSSCSGSRERTRSVKSHAALGGRPCHGGTKEVGRCNPADGDSSPPGCHSAGVPVDCELSDWSAWSECTRPCETGYKFRKRMLKKAPKNGGKSCPSNLEEMLSCNAQPCDKEKHGQKCVFGSWEKWTKCDAHTGSRKRFRPIAVKAIYGEDCDGVTEEVEPCTTKCKMNVMHFCVWSKWSTWSKCSRSCGPEGRTTRTRKLFTTREDAGYAPGR